MEEDKEDKTSLEDLIQELSIIVKDYNNVIDKNFDLIFNSKTEKKTFLSDLGIEFYQQFSGINTFWTQILSPKDIMNALSKVYQTVKDSWNKNKEQEVQNDQNDQNEDQQETKTREEKNYQDYILSMTILMLSGLIDDYLKNMRKIVFETLYEQGLKDQAINLIENFRMRSKIAKIDLLIKVMDEKKDVKKLIQKYNLTPWRGKFEAFNSLRNQLAHSGYKIDGSLYETESQIVMEYVKQNIKTNDGKEVNNWIKNLLFNLTTESLPLISKIAIVTVDAFVYLSILDRVYYYWSNSE